jgi:hypothetical protein
MVALEATSVNEGIRQSFFKNFKIVNVIQIPVLVI